MESSPDWLAIAVASVFNIIIGSLWYSKWLFRQTWLKLMDKKERQLSQGWQPVIWGFVVSLVIAYFLEFFQRLLGITTVSDGMFLGFYVWLGFVATSQLCSVIWCKESWRLFAIESGYRLVSLLVMSGIIGA